MSITSYKNGAKGETNAAEFLKKQGYKIVTTNYRCKLGEIDIIARDGDTLVFVEVKSCQGKEFGTPGEYITQSKMQKLRKAATMYMHQKGIDFCDARFDVVEIQADQPTLIKDAF